MTVHILAFIPFGGWVGKRSSIAIFQKSIPTSFHEHVSMNKTTQCPIKINIAQVKIKLRINFKGTLRRNPTENRAISGFSGQKSVPE